VNSPNPALVTERAASRLPRVALLLLCAAYLLPGLFGRDPWKSADITAFGYMMSLAKGHGSWLTPTVGGLAGDGALIPYWLGAGFIEVLGPWLGAPLAARIPFALLLGLVMMLTWHTTFYLARTEAAQPLAFAFGGEAKPIDYARAVADGALLALIASLGLLQLGHETTPELGQLVGITLFLYALAASPFRVWRSRAALLASLPMMAASGAPTIATTLGIAGLALCMQSKYETVRKQAVWVLGSMALAAIAATAFGAWGWRLRYDRFGSLAALLRQLIWFLWPTWPLALWTLWRWRKHLRRRHISVPLASVLIALAAYIAMGRSDRVLMLALPALAVLAAFILPTLQRSTAAALDWFSVFFFTICALFVWVMYAAMQTGWPAKPAANVAKLAIGFTPTFSWFALVPALLASAAWLWLVQWRAGRNRHPLWKSLVLPAGGVALCWLLAMTLWLPVLDYALSYRPLVARVARHVPAGSCVAAPGMNKALIVAFEYFGGYTVDAASDEQRSSCPVLLISESRVYRPSVSAGWTLVAREVRPTDNDTIVAVYKRTRLASLNAHSRD